MKITLKNIAKVKEAEIEINGITVIAGENDTGKSTVGKALFAVFNSLYDIERQIEKVYVKEIKEILFSDFFFDPQESKLSKLHKNEIETIAKNRANFNDVKKDIEILLDSLSLEDKDYDDKKESITQLLCISDEEIFKQILLRKLNTCFHDQVGNIYLPSENKSIELSIKNMDFSVSGINLNNINDIYVANQFPLHTEVIYIDNPFVLDTLAYSFIDDEYRNSLKKTLITSKGKNTPLREIITAKTLSIILSKIDSICDGEIISGKGSSFLYQKKNASAHLNVENISAGLKTFVILKTLLLNSALTEKGVIILDEPEIHLHPELQLVFAEIIVLLQKEFNLHVLINTHSPYFLRAIQVYAGKHEIADKCNYYLAKNEDSVSIIKDVSDDIEKIYQKLAYPLQKLEDERWKDD